MPQGITLVVLTHNRKTSLTVMLESLQAQNLQGIPLEIILCNNASEYELRPSRWDKLGRVLGALDGVRIVNASFNWRTDLRYAMAMIGEYDTILQLDDDVMLLSPDFIAQMFDRFQSLEKYDIVSCWNSIWTTWNDTGYSYTGINFWKESIHEMIPCDTAGMGICMYPKALLAHQTVMDATMCRTQNLPNATDMAFSIGANMAFGSTVYYMPSQEMLGFHEQYKDNAMSTVPAFYQERFEMYRLLMNRGYVRLLEREQYKDDERLLSIVNSLPSTVYDATDNTFAQRPVGKL